MERFKFPPNEDFRYNMIQKVKELDANDPYYEDLCIVIGDYRRIV